MRCADERYVYYCGRLMVLPNSDAHVSDAVSIDYSVAELTVIDRIRLDPFERNGRADSIKLVYTRTA